MKKVLTKILITVLLVCSVFSLFACGGIIWKQSDVNLTDWGNVDATSNGGFVAQTENYVYFINGEGDATAHNKFGAPIKGSLVAVDKADPFNTCIVVPKLFVAQDYKAGLHISGDYVYYATPSTSKNASGGIANDELAFIKTKLDGSTGDSENFFSVKGITTAYRFVELEGVVYIVYYDADDTALYSFNTSDKTKTLIFKTDVKAESESLLNYTMVNVADADKTAVLFTTTVYDQAYDEKAATDANYQRSSAPYNKLYAYIVGEEQPRLIYSGDADEIDYTYSVSFIKEGKVFLTKTEANTNGITKATNYVANIADLLASPDTALSVVTNANYFVETTILASNNTAYMLSTDTYAIRLIGMDNGIETEKTVAKTKTAITNLLFADGDYVYYVNANSELARINVKVGEDGKTLANEQRVSQNKISTTWYTPEIMGDYVYYVDASDVGCNYVKRTNVKDDSLIVEEKDDKGEITLTYIDGEQDLGIKTDADAATIFGGYVAKAFFNEKIVFDTDKDGNIKEDADGNPYFTELDKAIEVYSKLSDAQKRLVAEESNTKYNKLIQAYKLSKAFYRLYDFDSTMTTAEKDAYSDAYQNAKAVLEEVLQSKVDTEVNIRALNADRLNWFYQEASKYFEKD